MSGYEIPILESALLRPDETVIIPAGKTLFEAVRDGTAVWVCGPKSYRAILWETEGKRAWESRDWRRLKRERRKFMRRAAK